MSRHTWSTAQTEVLIETYPHIPTAWIAAVFGLGIKQVHSKAESLGLRKTPAFMERVCRPAHRQQKKRREHAISARPAALEQGNALSGWRALCRDPIQARPPQRAGRRELQANWF